MWLIKRIAIYIALIVGGFGVVLLVVGMTDAGNTSHPAKEAKSEGGGYPTKTIKQAALGCSSEKVFNRIGKIASEGDKATALRYAKAEIYNGTCTLISKGKTVVVEHAGFFGPSKVRPIGSVVSFWVDNANLN